MFFGTHGQHQHLPVRLKCMTESYVVFIPRWWKPETLKQRCIGERLLEPAHESRAAKVEI